MSDGAAKPEPNTEVKPFLNPVSFLAQKWCKLWKKKKGPKDTLTRVCTSEHLQELQWIASFAILAWAILPHYLPFSYFGGLSSALAGILAWVYITGSTRLGAIDLFSCEISVICRVCQVIEFPNLSVLMLEKAKENEKPSSPPDPPGEKKEFTSEENYTPVYEKTLSDLQPLDADVVTSVTEFYTYRKTMMDYLRKIAKLGDDVPTLARVRYVRQMIYMQFLMYESGRKAVQRLVDFEPNRAESLINFYRSELVLYSCLLTDYKDLNNKLLDERKKDKETTKDKEPTKITDSWNAKFLFDRLDKRKAHYRKEVPLLINKIEKEPDTEGGDWEKAKTSVCELRDTYDTISKALKF